MPTASARETPTQAIIIAGGQGTRMRPYTENVPKVMVPVAGIPILAYQLLWLAEYEVKTVVLSAGYRAEVLDAYAGDGAQFGLGVRMIVEDRPLGRGGGMKFAARHLPDPDAPFYALNSDVITHFPLDKLAAHHRAHGARVTVALAPYRSHWGVAELDGERIRRFVQSPRLPYWINAGVYLIEPEVVGLLPDRGDHEDSTFPRLARDGGLVGFRLDGYWRGIDTVKDVKEASAELDELGLVPAAEFRPPATEP